MVDGRQRTASTTDEGDNESWGDARYSEVPLIRGSTIRKFRVGDSNVM